eukprot:6467257-Amphidinium_carterae.2
MLLLSTVQRNKTEPPTRNYKGDLSATATFKNCSTEAKTTRETGLMPLPRHRQDEVQQAPKCELATTSQRQFAHFWGLL